MSAYLAPDSDSASKEANGPPQVVSTPILIAPSGALAGAAAVWDDEDDEPPPPPQAARASIAALTTTTTRPGPASRFLEFLIDSPAPAEGRREPLPFRSTDNRLTINADDRDHIFRTSSVAGRLLPDRRHPPLQFPREPLTCGYTGTRQRA